jgi:hypothetical protein
MMYRVVMPSRLASLLIGTLGTLVGTAFLFITVMGIQQPACGNRAGTGARNTSAECPAVRP